ncbi:hypothetical protein KKB64_00165 [Patescibacteria group bacterium]|nr:hypothetical protein [Patescibacteria group bacterium]MBU1472189.1 hypothetical protein [Patescibacteria group bacterium]MBU2459583.1 hypothetical protein [Patescibacteria group bacterium]MBU2544176.1 hypothetical protein [Patescibacteria group bacterium]
MKVFAAPTGIPLGTIGEGGGLGPFSDIVKKGSDGTAAVNAIAATVSSIIGIMTIAAGIWFIFQFLVGGMNWITSGGDKAKLEAARDRITNAFIGLIIVVAGWAILALASQFFGVDFLLTKPGELIKLKLQ